MSVRLTPKTIPAPPSLPLLGTLACILAGSGPTLAEQTSWKQDFAACAGNSPFIETLLTQNGDSPRPLMRIGEMQAWAVRDSDGQPAIALTTQDGLTIIGRIWGPQGEDISAALLATRPNPADLSDQPHITGQAPALTPDRHAQIENSGETVSPSLERLMDNTQHASGASPAPVAPTDRAEVVSAPITAAVAPTPEVQAGMDAIFKQATEERVWFSAATPKADAPVVYMLTDPECPHCQWTIDKMHSQIISGEIDLRIIFAPITGVAGFNSSLSILHSDNIPVTFIAHMTSNTRSTEAVSQMDINAADRAVVQGIIDNINWMRTNRMPGVPFFLYQTDEGTRFAFSELPSDILQVAK